MDFDLASKLRSEAIAHQILFQLARVVLLIGIFSSTPDIPLRITAVAFLLVLDTGRSLLAITLLQKVDALERSLWLDQLTWRELYRATRLAEVDDWAAETQRAMRSAIEDIKSTMSASAILRSDNRVVLTTINVLSNALGLVVEVAAAIWISHFVPGWLASLGLT